MICIKFSGTTESRPEIQTLVIPKKKIIERSWCILNIAVPADHRVKLKENEKREKYLDLARELKYCGTRELLMVIGALETDSKALEKGLEESEIRGQIDTIKISALLS